MEVSKFNLLVFSNIWPSDNIRQQITNYKLRPLGFKRGVLNLKSKLNL